MALLKFKQTVNPYERPPPVIDPVTHTQIMDCTITDTMRQLMWKVIVGDPIRKQRGWGLTNDTITKEGMTTDEIQAVLKKKLIILYPLYLQMISLHYYP